MKIFCTALIRSTKPEFAKTLVAPAPELTSKYVIQTRRLSHIDDNRYMVARFTYDISTGKRFFKSFTQYGDGSETAEGITSRFMREFGEEIRKTEEYIYQNVGTTTTSLFGEDPSTEPTSEEPTKNPWLDGFFVQDNEMEAFEVAAKLAGEIPTKILIIGASGYGKTSLPKAFAAKKGMEYVRFNTALVRDPEEFFGWRTVQDGNVEFIPSPFTRAITQGNTVVVLDELNRATPEMANAIFPILDDDGKTEVFGNQIKVGPNTIIVATVNIGYQFVGTFAIDQALLNRMDITLRVSPLPQTVEVEVLQRRTGLDARASGKIVNICNKLRELTANGKIVIDASTRTSLRIARLVANGVSISDAFSWTLINGADEDERKEVIDAISAHLD